MKIFFFSIQFDVNYLGNKKLIDFFFVFAQETITDEKPENMTLNDLGVRLQYIEEHWHHLLAIWRYNGFYDGDLGETRIFEHPIYTLDH